MLTSVAEAAEQSEGGPGRAGRWWQWLVVSCYLLGAVVLTWGLWADPASRVLNSDPGDIDQFNWFLRYSATAVSHGRLPGFVTTAMNAPAGFNLLWNTSGLLLGSVLTPVTLLAGSQVADTVILTLGLAGSAASLFVVLRRWGASISAAALGGAVYGFSPFIIASGIHLQIEFAVLPPLIIDALLRLVTGRGSTVRTGLWLGLLASAQLFISEEMLLFTVIAGGLLAVLLALSWPRAAASRAAAALPGLAIGAGVGLLLCGDALWIQFRDKLVPASHPAAAGTTAPAISLTSATRPAAATTAAPPGGPAHQPLAYVSGDGPGALIHQLRWPLFVVLVAAAIVFWRNPKIRIAAIAMIVLDLLALGGLTQPLTAGLHYPATLHPWYWLSRLPVLKAALAGRFAILANGAAGALLAFSLDHARTLIPATPSQPPAPTHRLPSTRYRPTARTAVTAAAVLLLLPALPRPYHVTTAVPLPAGWQAAFTRLALPPHARVLIAPFPYGRIPQPLRWQADTGQPATMIGGDFIGYNQRGNQQRAGRTALTRTAQYIDDLWTGTPPATTPTPQQINANLTYWHPAAVIAVTTPATPLARFLTRIFGPPTYHIDAILAWQLHPHPATPATTTSSSSQR